MCVIFTKRALQVGLDETDPHCMADAMAIEAAAAFKVKDWLKTG
jgi:hypothetical protein